MSNHNFQPEEQEHLQPHVPEEEKEPYTPRPRWQVVLAWVLLGIVAIGIFFYCYWQIAL